MGYDSPADPWVGAALIVVPALWVAGVYARFKVQEIRQRRARR